MNISHDCANVHHEERSNAISSAGVPNGGGLVKLRSSGAKRQWRLLSTDRIGDETSQVFLVMKMFMLPVAACLKACFKPPLQTTLLHFAPLLIRFYSTLGI